MGSDSVGRDRPRIEYSVNRAIFLREAKRGRMRDGQLGVVVVTGLEKGQVDKRASEQRASIRKNVCDVSSAIHLDPRRF